MFSEWKTGDRNLPISVSPEMIISELACGDGIASSLVEIAILEFMPEGWFAIGSMPKSGTICKRGDDSRFIKLGDKNE